MDIYVHLQTSCARIYNNYIILGDFNMKPSDSLLNAFMQSHNLFNLIKLTQASKGVVLSQI